jgi:hypothetical protein
MLRRTFLSSCGRLAGLGICYTIGAPGPAAAQTYVDLEWRDLLPPGEDQEIARQRAMTLRRAAPHGSLEDDARPMSELQFGTFNTVRSLHGRRSRLKGYVVPLDVRLTSLDAFLLVPFFGACLHAPPPPPNQTVFVRARQTAKIDSLYRPVECQGTLKIVRQSSEMGASAYELDLDRLKRL